MTEIVDELRKKYSATKAEVMMKIAGFIFSNHDNRLLQLASRGVGWLNRKRYGNNVHSFLNDEESIDIMDDSRYEDKGGR